MYFGVEEKIFLMAYRQVTLFSSRRDMHGPSIHMWPTFKYLKGALDASPGLRDRDYHRMGRNPATKI